MPLFRYSAITRSGQPAHGEIDAESASSARAQLVQRGLFADTVAPLADKTAPLTDAPRPSKTYRTRIPERRRVELISQLATALMAHLPILTAIEVVAQQNPSRRLTQVLRSLADSIRSGHSLSHAMAQYPRIFDDLHLSMVRAGEAAGTLDRSMEQLAQLSERDFETRGAIMTAALYPAFVLSLGLISTAIVVTWILPRVIGTLAADIALMPWPTRVVMAAATFLRQYGWIVTVILIAALLVFQRWRQTKSGRYLVDSFKLRLPMLGPLRCKWAVSRFARTLGTLCKGGINILDALHIVRNSLGNERLACEIDLLAQRVRSGAGMAEPLRRSGHFPPLLVQIVSVAEQTGQLPDLLLGAARAFDKETDVAVKRFMAIFPAILILLLAALVGFIVAATLLPIVQVEVGLGGF